MSAAISGRYQQAVDLARAALAQNPEFPGGFRTLAVGLAYLDCKIEAASAVQELLKRVPGLTLKSVGERLPFSALADQDSYLKGLRIAGLVD